MNSRVRLVDHSRRDNRMCDPFSDRLTRLPRMPGPDARGQIAGRDHGHPLRQRHSGSRLPDARAEAGRWSPLLL